MAEIPIIPPPYDGGQPTAYGLAKLCAQTFQATERLDAKLHPNRARVDVEGERPDGAVVRYILTIEWVGIVKLGLGHPQPAAE